MMIPFIAQIPLMFALIFHPPQIVFNEYWTEMCYRFANAEFNDGVNIKWFV